MGLTLSTEISLAAQKQLCGLVVPHKVQAQGAASLAALSALCMYLKRCHADKELATGTHKVRLLSLAMRTDLQETGCRCFRC